MTGKEKIKVHKDEFPKLYILATESKHLMDGIYSSVETDGSSLQYNGYFQVRDNEITAIGEEMGRDGGWFWIAR